jgi:hypothetical protein
MQWSFYDTATGLFNRRRVTCAAGQTLERNTPAGHAALAGDFDPLSQRVNLQTGQVEDYQPPAPAADELRTWAWNDATRRWAASPTDAAVAIDVRAERDKRLTACDWVTVRAVELGEEIPPDWLAYRASLRAVPEQPGFPRAIDWPTPPAE